MDYVELSRQAVRFVGGQLEVRNPGQGYLFRGEIAAIRVEGRGDSATLYVIFKWLALGEGFPPRPNRWVRAHARPYAAPLSFYSVSDSGDGRLGLYSKMMGETSVLYPPGGSKLDPERVDGLNASGEPT